MSKVFVIAEAGVNHNGSVETAKLLVDAAVESGADAVKFQTFRAEHLVSVGTEKVDYQTVHTGAGDQYEMLKQLELSRDEHIQLYQYCAERRIEFMSTGFDAGSVDFLQQIGVLRLKVPSGEITNHPLIRHMAAKNLPMLLSTGMSDMTEVSAAVEVVRSARRDNGFADDLSGYLTVLHCTSNYPTALVDVNLRAMLTMASELKVAVGYSDHTEGTLVSTAAVAMGASVIEKHITLDKSMPGPDHAASLEPHEFCRLVREVRAVELALGDGNKMARDSERSVRRLVRRSMVLNKALASGHKIASEDLMMLRPAAGIAPSELGRVIGRKLRTDLREGHILTWDDLAE